MKLFCQTFTFLCLIVLGSQVASAQDIIVKTDQTEIKAKVLEIEESKIKYKRFDHQDGPTHNIAKQEVFMIIYQNGKRETFTQAGAVQAAASETPVAKNTKVIANNTKVETTDTPIPDVRLRNGLELSTNIEALSYGVFNLTILTDGTNWIKPLANYLRTGASWSLVGDGAGDIGAVALLLNATPHLPLNRLLGNYEKQNMGLFPFVRFGAGVGLTFPYDPIEGEEGVVVGFAHQVAVGAEYLFTRHLGVTVYSDKFQTFSAGVSIRF